MQNKGEDTGHVTWAVSQVIGMAFALGASLVEGWALMVLWGWFVVGHFGASPLPLGVAVGLCLIVGVVSESIAHHLQVQDRSKLSAAKKAKTLFIFSLVRPAFAVGLGWVVRALLL